MYTTVPRPVHMYRTQNHICLSTASRTSVVLLVPPKSGVRICPSRRTSSTALSIFPAATGYPRCRSMSAALRIAASGLAMLWPAMSGAEPCTLLIPKSQTMHSG